MASKDSSDAVLAVVHGWLRNPAYFRAKSLLVGCLVNRGELAFSWPFDNKQTEDGKLVAVEWAFSGKPVPGRLSVPHGALHGALTPDECANCVAALQTKVAKMLDAHQAHESHKSHVVGTTLPQDLRLFAGHGGPELTWPDLVWFPDRPACPPPETAEGLKLLRNSGVVLVATRGDFGTKMLDEKAILRGTWCARGVHVLCFIWTSNSVLHN
jgi:hypothetical protein